MKPQEVIEMIRKAVIDVRDSNEKVVSVNALLNCLDALDRDVVSIDESDGKKLEVDLAMFRAEHERNLAHYDAQQQSSRQMWDSVFTYGQAALKSAILINGGAAAGLLASKSTPRVNVNMPLGGREGHRGRGHRGRSAKLTKSYASRGKYNLQMRPLFILFLSLLHPSVLMEKQLR